MISDTVFPVCSTFCTTWNVGHEDHPLTLDITIGRIAFRIYAFRQTGGIEILLPLQIYLTSLMSFFYSERE
jgi:hypothetical protein